jgi:Uncharacterised nucleotidyltransferase
MTSHRSTLRQALEKPDLWPAPTQLLLLRACLESGAEARDAWEEWSSLVDFDRLDGESWYLLPLLDKNLRAIGISEHPWLGRIKGCRRYIWAKNRQLLARSSQVIQELRSVVGDNLLIIKGAALAWGHYSDPGLRPTRDFDCMVKAKSVSRILRHFKSLGWKIPRWIDWDQNRHAPNVETQRRVDQIPPNCWTDYSDGSVRQPAGQQSILTDDRTHIDLHWCLMPDLCGAAANETFWNNAVVMRLPDGSEVRTLQSTDLLFHCCLHGLIWEPWSPIPSTRWIVDAVTLLRDTKSIRWRRLVELAEQLCYTLRLGTALSYVASTFPRQTCIPEDVIHSLLSRDHSAEEIDEYQTRMGLSPDGQEYSPNMFPYMFTYYHYRRFRFTHYCRNRSMPMYGNWLQEIRAFACYLRVSWGLPNLWLVFVIAPFRAARRIYRQIFSAGRARSAAGRC